MKRAKIIIFILASTFLLTSCIKISNSTQHRRVVTLPQGHELATIETCQRIVASLTNDGLAEKLMVQFPGLDQEAFNGISIQPSQGTFSETGKEVFIMIIVHAREESSKMEKVADFIAEFIKKKVDTFFGESNTAEA